MHLTLEIAQASGTDWFQLIPAALGAVLGAAASAIPAYRLAKLASKETLARDRESRSAAQKTEAFRLMTKVQRVANNLEGLRRQIEESFGEAAANGGAHLPAWMQVKPMIGVIPRLTEFTAEEIALLFAAKASELANEIMELGNRHDVDEEVLLDYSRRRRELGDLLGLREPTKEQLDLYGPRMIELSDAITILRANLAEDAATALKLLPRVAKVMCDHFGEPEMFKINFAGPAQE